MDAKTHAKYTARAKIIKALAHPTRLFLVDQLTQNGPKCVCDLTAMVGTDVSTVSRHLALLKDAGILADEKRGSMVYYRPRLKCVVDFCGCIESVLEQNAKEQQRLLR